MDLSPVTAHPHGDRCLGTGNDDRRRCKQIATAAQKLDQVKAGAEVIVDIPIDNDLLTIPGRVTRHLFLDEVDEDPSFQGGDDADS